MLSLLFLMLPCSHSSVLHDREDAFERHDGSTRHSQKLTQSHVRLAVMLRQISFSQVLDRKLRKGVSYLISHMFYLVCVLSRKTVN